VYVPSEGALRLAGGFLERPAGCWPLETLSTPCAELAAELDEAHRTEVTPTTGRRCVVEDEHDRTLASVTV